MRFKVDENLPIELAELLRNAGFDAMTVHEQGMVGSPDDNLFEICCQEGRTVVTFDLDFSDIRTYPPEDSPGLIVFRLNLQEKSYVLEWANKMISLLSREQVAGHLWIVSEQGIRIRGGAG